LQQAVFNSAIGSRFPSQSFVNVEDWGASNVTGGSKIVVKRQFLIGFRQAGIYHSPTEKNESEKITAGFFPAKVRVWVKYRMFDKISYIF
tara:strand:- start:386 stop:655 length:270 start_codon:yes stop_codon:yes gene_type:complete